MKQGIDRIINVLLIAMPLITLFAWILTWPKRSDMMIGPCYLLFCYSLFVFGAALTAKSFLRIRKRQQIPFNIVLIILGVLVSSFFLCTVTGIPGRLTDIGKSDEMPADPKGAGEYLDKVLLDRSVRSPERSAAEIVAAIESFESEIDVDALESTLDCMYKKEAKTQSWATQGISAEGPGGPTGPSGPMAAYDRDVEPARELSAIYSKKQWSPEALQEFENKWIGPINELTVDLTAKCSEKYGHTLNLMAESDNDQCMEYLSAARAHRFASRLLRAGTLYHNQKDDLKNAVMFLELQRNMASNYEPSVLIDYLAYTSAVQQFYSTIREICFSDISDHESIKTLQHIAGSEVDFQNRLLNSLSGELIYMRFNGINGGYPASVLNMIEDSFAPIVASLSESNLKTVTEKTQASVAAIERKIMQGWNITKHSNRWKVIPWMIYLTWKPERCASEILKGMLLPAWGRIINDTYALSVNQRITVLCCKLKEYKLKHGIFPKGLELLADGQPSGDETLLPSGYSYLAKNQRFVLYNDFSEEKFPIHRILETMHTGMGALESFGSNGLLFVIGE